MKEITYDSFIDYTGNDYAFIINKIQQATLYNFTINCSNNGGGIYIKYASGEAQTNNLTSTDFIKVYIYNSKNPFKNDCHCGYVNFNDCVFEVGTTDGIAVDFRGSYYPEFITIERCKIRTIYRDTSNTSTGIYFNSGLMINILNNDIIGFYNAFVLDATGVSENMRTINLLHNSFWDTLNKAVYVTCDGSNKLKNIAIKDSTVTSSQRADTLAYAFHLVAVNGIAIDNISITQLSDKQVFLSNCQVGHVRDVYCSRTIIQSNNQLGDYVNYEYTNYRKSYTVPANDHISVELGYEKNIFDFKNYLIAQRGANNSTEGLSISNQSISGGKITFTLTNTTSNSINVNVVGI